MWGKDHIRLQSVCIYLWPVPEECRQLVAESGVDSRQMNFGEPPSFFWESVILQCEKQNTLHKLVPVLLSRYPGNTDLQDVVEPWLDKIPVQRKKAKTTEKVEQMKQAQETLPVTITVATADLAKQDVITKPSQNVDDDELVPVRVPKGFEEDATVTLIASFRSLRMAVVDLSNRLNKMEQWREAISTMSRAEVENKEGLDAPDKAPRDVFGNKTQG